MPRIRQCPGSTVPLVEVAPGGLNCATVICVGVSGKFVRVARLTHALTGSERASAPKLVCAPKPARDAPARSLASTENGRRGVAGECPDFIRTSRIWLVRSRAGDTRNVTRRRQKVTCRRPCPAAQLLRPALPPSARARSIFENWSRFGSAAQSSARRPAGVAFPSSAAIGRAPSPSAACSRQANPPAGSCFEQMRQQGFQNRARFERLGIFLSGEEG